VDSQEQHEGQAGDGDPESRQAQWRMSSARDRAMGVPGSIWRERSNRNSIRVATMSLAMVAFTLNRQTESLYIEIWI
jgi:hypothetical protein